MVTDDARGMRSEPRPALHAVLVTYRRPDELARSIRSLTEQTLPVASLVVVDNDGGAADWLDKVRDELPFPLESLVPKENVGPAGGFAHGVDVLLRREGAEDWVVLLDDDDPLPSSRLLEDLVLRRDALLSTGVRIGGIGGKGARFDLRWGRTRPVPKSAVGVYEVDHLHGGYAPIYRLAALRDAGNFRQELFWGFEELDVGLRLNDAGWRLFVDADVLRWLPPTEKLRATSGRPRLLVSVDSFERRYYAHRNLDFIAWERSSALRLRAALALRQVGKPVVNMLVRPRVAAPLLRWNLRARRDARHGNLGRTVSLG